MTDTTRKLVIKSLRKRGATVSVAAARKAVRDVVGAAGGGKGAAKTGALRSTDTATGSGKVAFKFPTRVA